MKIKPSGYVFALIAAVMLLLAISITKTAGAHCDTMDGPVVMDAKKALEAGDITPVLKWIRPEHEKEIKEVFKKTIEVRKEGEQARELADMYFFETLVRLHRAGEGAPYTGLKPAGEVEPIIEAADKALETGSVDELVKHINFVVEKGIRDRFRDSVEKKKHAGDSVDEGREFVESYVIFVHYVEGIHNKASGHSTHGSKEKAGSAHKHE